MYGDLGAPGVNVKLRQVVCRVGEPLATGNAQE